MWVSLHKYLQIMERNPTSKSMTSYEWAPWPWMEYKYLRREPLGFFILCYYFNYKTSGLNTDHLLIQEPTQENFAFRSVVNFFLLKYDSSILWVGAMFSCCFLLNIWHSSQYFSLNQQLSIICLNLLKCEYTFSQNMLFKGRILRDLTLNFKVQCSHIYKKIVFFLSQLKTPCKSQTGLTRTKQSWCQRGEGKGLDKPLSAGVVRKHKHLGPPTPIWYKNVQDIILS